VVPSLGSWVLDRGSVVIAAPTAPDRSMDLNLFAGLRVFDQLAEVDHALIAGGAVALFLLVLVVDAAARRVEWIAGRRYPYLVHSSSTPFLWAGLRGVCGTAGAVFMCRGIVSHPLLLCNTFRTMGV